MHPISDLVVLWAVERTSSVSIDGTVQRRHETTMIREPIFETIVSVCLSAMRPDRPEPARPLAKRTRSGAACRLLSPVSRAGEACRPRLAAGPRRAGQEAPATTEPRPPALQRAGRGGAGGSRGRVGRRLPGIWNPATGAFLGTLQAVPGAVIL